jgi:hypothetical protein
VDWHFVEHIEAYFTNEEPDYEISGSMTGERFLKEIRAYNSKIGKSNRSESIEIIKGDYTSGQRCMRCFSNVMRNVGTVIFYFDTRQKADEIMIELKDTQGLTREYVTLPWRRSKSNFADYIYEKYAMSELQEHIEKEATENAVIKSFQNLDTDRIQQALDKCVQAFQELQKRLSEVNEKLWTTSANTTQFYQEMGKCLQQPTYITTMKSSLDNDNYRWASAIKADSPDSVSIYTKDTNDCIATWLNDATLTTVADTTIASNTLYVNDGISINDYIDNKIYQAFEKKNEPTENENANNKGDKTMNMMNFDFGAVRGDSVHLSMYGIAIKNKNGRWASYDAKSQSIMDVEVFNVGGQNYLYKMPVGVDDVKVGDVIIHSKVPMFVTAINKSEDGKVLSFKAVDPYAGEEKTVLPLKNMFNFNFVTKIVSIMDGFGGFSADEKNPFGNMLPLMVFGDNDADIDPMMLMLMMNAQGDGAGINQNLLLALALNKESGSKDNMLPMLMMMGMNKN